MFYRLKNNYMLRGWEKMTCILVQVSDNSIRKLNQDEFQCLLLCDGETEWQDDLLTREFSRILLKYEQDGIIEKSEVPLALNEEQYYRYYDNRYVRSVTWSVTGGCNYRCRHCYMDAPNASMGEMPAGQALELIDQMAECGVLTIDITGGEPFVRKDFWTLVDRILAHRMRIGMIYTNGWLLNDRILDGFEQRGVKPHFSISFDGIGWHDWMRGVEGAEAAALRAMKLCRKRGFYVNAEMCIHRGNQDSLPETVEVLRAAGITDLKVGSVSPTELWRKNDEGNGISEKEYVEAMLRYIPQYFKAGRPMQIMLANVINLHTPKNAKPYTVLAEKYDGTDQCMDCYLCAAARSACYITPEGRLLPCMPMTASSAIQSSFPKIQDIGLKKGLSDSFYMQFVDKRVKDLLSVNRECASCPHRFSCGGGCRAIALLEGDYDLMGADRTQCMMWKEGYVERIHRVADEAVAKYCK